MYFTDFPEANFSYTKPKDMRDDQCATLRVQRGIYDLKGKKMQLNISAWKPDPEDIERINNGGLIYLNIFGEGHPMVSMTTEKYEVEPVEVQPKDN